MDADKSARDARAALRRLAALTAPEPRFTRGVYAGYPAAVGSASEDAVVMRRGVQTVSVDA